MYKIDKFILNKANIDSIFFKESYRDLRSTFLTLFMSNIAILIKKKIFLDPFFLQFCATKNFEDFILKIAKFEVYTNKDIFINEEFQQN